MIAGKIKINHLIFIASWQPILSNKDLPVKARIKKLIQSFLKNTLGIQIHRVKAKSSQAEKPKLKMRYEQDPAFSYMEDPVYQDRLMQELAQIGDSFRNKGSLPSYSDSSSLSIVKDFFRIYSSRKLTDNTHGSGFHNAFWLYFIARFFNPELIVESGVWKGHSSWLLHQACPEAEQYGFDISLNKFEIPELRSQMFQQDWGSFEFPSFNPDRALIFFDCHVNHAQRILEAKEKGFKHILFDDNPPIHKVYSHIPGIPTAAMLVANEGIDATSINWVWNGEKVSRSIDPAQAHQARDLIKVHEILPDVGGPTRYGGFAFLTYVQI